MTKLPGFGEVSKAELQMTDCSFEKGAPAMVIFDEAESSFRLNLASPSNPYFEQTDHRIRIKIFNEKGFNNANVRIRYPTFNKTVNITRLSAQTYNLDETGNIVVSKVEKATIFDKAINSRYSEKIFAFPGVKAGSVIEYSYRLDNASRSEWYFQKSIPVQFSRFIVDFPPELIMSVMPYCTLPLSQQKSERKGAGNYTWYTMNNIPALKDEPFMSCREDYLQRLESHLVAIDFPGIPRKSLIRTWPEIIKDLVDDEDFGRQLNKNLPRTSELEAMIRAVDDDYKKMCIIHKYVRNNMEWNKYDNIWALDGVKSAWKDKKGTSGEINLILINLLKDAGLKAFPILVSTRENGIINTGVAGYSQFNKVLAYVQIKDKVYVLDATEKNTPSHLIPFDVMASEGLVIKKIDTYEWGWKTLWDEAHQEKNDVFINAEIDANGVMKGQATVKVFDYEKMKQLELLKEGENKFKETIVAKQDIKIDSFLLKDADNDTLPLSELIKFTAQTPSSGNYRYFSINYFAGLNSNPFIAEERKTDVFYGVNQQYHISGNVFLPDGFQMDGLPKNIKMITSDTGIVFKRKSSYSDGFLFVDISLVIRKSYFTPEDYTELREFYKKLTELLDEKYVYQKK
jgi:hypothetical protein